MIDKKAVNPARSLYYGLFSKLFAHTQNENRYENVAEVLDVMIANPIDANCAKALKELKEFLLKDNGASITKEYDLLFNHPSGETIRTTASFYDEGVESGKKRLEMIGFVAKTKIRRNEKKYFEYEDSVGFLFTFMHELAELIIAGDDNYETLQHCVFKEIINEFIEYFIHSLFENKNANIFASVAVILNTFMEFERAYFDVSKAAMIDKKNNKSAIKKGADWINDDSISQEEKDRRMKNRAKKDLDMYERGNKDASLVFTGKEEMGDL